LKEWQQGRHRFQQRQRQWCASRAGCNRTSYGEPPAALPVMLAGLVELKAKVGGRGFDGNGGGITEFH
jgi:hypothetical protein